MLKKQIPKKLKILLDLQTLTTQSSKTLMEYPDNDFFELIGLEKFQDRKYVEIVYDNKQIKTIVIHNPRDVKNVAIFPFRYLTDDILDMAKYLSISFERIMPVFILSLISNARPHYSEEKVILITENKALLNKKMYTKFGFSSLPQFSILHPDEANPYIDLFVKTKGEYLISPIGDTNKGLWYLFSMKSKLVNFQLPWSIAVHADTSFPNKQEFMDVVASLGDRITDMLIAIDEIGICYYEGSDNDTLDTSIYHFNYWISLFTGVLDSLGWITKYRYQITYNDITKQGIRKKLHKEFLKLVFVHNSQLLGFLDKNDQIINLMYNPRDIVIHRDRLKGTRYQEKSESLSLNLVKISEIFFNNIVAISKEKGTTIEKWGHLKLDGIPHEYYLEPYSFVKKTTEELIVFVNKYIDQLSFTDYFTQYPDIKKEIDKSNVSKISTDFEHNRIVFIKYKLGY